MNQYNYFLQVKTDNDVRVYYNNKSYGYYEPDLKIEGTGTLTEIQIILNSIDVVNGHKRTDFTVEFLKECWYKVLNLNTSSINCTRKVRNEEYTFTLEKVPVIKHVAKGEKPVMTPERYQYEIDLAGKVMKRQDEEISKLKMLVNKLRQEKLK
jgi:hypothetical protein